MTKSLCKIEGCDKPHYGRGMCSMHYQRWRLANLELISGAQSLEERFWSKVNKTNTCWLWAGSAASNGYGRFNVGKKYPMAHRFAYEMLVGPIPDELTIDHLCHTNDPTCQGGKVCLHRRCVNPAHLEPVTQKENLRRGLSPSAKNSAKTHCVRGHEFTADNTSIFNGRRSCKTCNRAKALGLYYRRKSQR